EVFDDLGASQRWIERELAREISDEAVDIGRLAPAVKSANCRATRGWMQETNKGANRGRLARAIWSEEAEDLAFVDAAGDGDDARAAAVGLAKALKVDDARHVYDFLRPC